MVRRLLLLYPIRYEDCRRPRGGSVSVKNSPAVPQELRVLIIKSMILMIQMQAASIHVCFPSTFFFMHGYTGS